MAMLCSLRNIGLRRSMGFTLIELLVVVAIITLLSGIILSVTQSARMKSRDGARLANAQQIIIALAQHESTAGTYRVAGAGYQGTGVGYISKRGTADYATAIATLLKSNGSYSSDRLNDQIFADEAYYIGACTDPTKYMLYMKVEQEALKFAPTTIQAGCDGANASALGFNYIYGQGPEDPNNLNPIGGQTTYPLLSTDNRGIAFDGSKMWTVTYYGNINVVASDGTVSFYGGLPTCQNDVAFDGINMWSAGNCSQRVSKITPTGVITTFVPGRTVQNIAFDGVNMWFTSTTDSSVTMITSSGTMTRYPTPGAMPFGIAFDGTNMWTADYYDSAVSKITPAGVATKYVIPGSVSPWDIAFDGTNMWTANTSSDSVTKVAPNGTSVTYPVGTGSYPNAIAFDGTNMWTANRNTNSVSRITPSGAVTTYPISGTFPTGIAFDGTYMWTINAGTNDISKIKAK